VRTVRPGWIVSLLAVFAAIAAGGTGAFLLWRYRAATLADRAERSAMMVRGRAHLLGEELAQLVAEVDRLSRLAEIDLADGTLEPEKRVLRIARRDTVLFSTAIAILGPDGDLLWSEPPGVRPGPDGATLVGLARGRGRSSPAFSAGEIDVAAPVPGRGAIVAVVGDRAGDPFGDTLRRSVLDAGTVSLVLSGPGGGEIAVARFPTGRAADSALRGGGDGQEWVEDGTGRRWLVTEALVPGSPLALRLVQSAQEVEGELSGPFRRLVAAVAATSLLVLAGGAALGLVFHRLERTEVELSRARDLAAMGKTAAAIAHEVKNALNGLSVALDLLASGRGDPGALRAVHAQARAEIDRLRDVADDLTLFAAPPRLALADVDLAALCRTAADAVAGLAQDCAVQVVVEADRPVPARADAAKLLGAVTNVARNGIESMGPGAFGEGLGEQRPVAERILSISAAALDGRAVVEVTDRGAGIAPEARARLFEPFVTTKRTGTGLGLAIARRVVEAHGGDIEALDRPGTGTVFRITLPAGARGKA
jgi:signal transduction histidine kinase